MKVLPAPDLYRPPTFARGVPLPRQAAPAAFQVIIGYPHPAHLDVEDAIAQFQSQLKKKRVKATEKLVAKAYTSDSMKAQRKLTTQVNGQRRIISDPPLIEPVEEVFAGEQASAIYKLIRETLGKYQRTLQSDRKHLLEEFTLVQVARKVVGVGSVGTRCWIALMDAGDGTEPLFLQPKEAMASSLAPYCGRSH